MQGIGLQSMRHRIEMLNGSFKIRNLKRGAKITASVPIASSALEKSASNAVPKLSRASQPGRSYA
jgi:signal transduction histidine kinase